MHKWDTGHLAFWVPASERASFDEALKTAAPALLGILAWGMVTGMAMVKSGLSISQSLGMTLIVFAGSMQLALLPLIAADAAIWVIFATACVVNLRFVIFSAAIGPHLSHLPWYKRLWYGYLNGDLTMALFSSRFPPHTLYQTQGKEGYVAGVDYANWGAWQLGSIAGIFLASQIPPSWGIAFAGTLALLAVLIPLIINVAALAGVVVAAGTAIATAHLPYRLGLLAAVVLGMASAMLVDTWIEQKKARERR